MKITLEKLHLMQQSLGKLITYDLPVATAFRLSRLAKQAKSEMDTLEESRTKLVTLFGDKDPDDPSRIKVTPQNLDKFSEEMRKLLAVEVNIDFEPINLSDLGDIKLSALDLANLDVFIVS
jgi:hypothetical protein